MKLELDSMDLSTFKYDTLRNQVPDKCVTADSLVIQDSERVSSGTGRFFFVRPNWYSTPTEASGDKPPANVYLRNPGTCPSHGGNSTQ